MAENEPHRKKYLHKGGVYGTEGLHSFDRQSRCEGHGMLLGDAHIVGALRESAADLVKSCATRHRSCDANQFKTTETNPNKN